MHALLVFTLSVFLISPTLSYGHEGPQRPEGQTLLHISASEKAEVAQDLLMATLKVQIKGASARAVQGELNQKMAKALRLLKGRSGLKLQTGRYYVRELYTYKPGRNSRRERVSDGWQSSQTLTLKGTKASAVLEGAGVLQDMGFLMQNLRFQISPEKFDTTHDSLMEKAVKKLQSQANRMAAALGKNKVAISELTINEQGRTPVHFRSMALAEASPQGAKVAAPIAEPGTEMISLTVRAQVLIGP